MSYPHFADFARLQIEAARDVLFAVLVFHASVAPALRRGGSPWFTQVGPRRVVAGLDHRNGAWSELDMTTSSEAAFLARFLVQSAGGRRTRTS